MAKHSILIVDHQNAVLGLAKKVLADDGYEVHVAGSSREAIDLSRGLGPELLVINPAMPTLSGVEAAREISRDAKCKVLFLSDLAKDSDFREMLRGLRQQGWVKSGRSRRPCKLKKSGTGRQARSRRT